MFKLYHFFVLYYNTITGHQIKKLLTDGSWISITKGITVVAGLTLAVAMANWLPPAIFGAYQFVFAVTGLIGALSLTGLNQAITRSVALGYEGAFWSGFWLRLKWSMAISPLILIVGGYFYFHNTKELALAFFLIAVSFPLFKSLPLFASYLSGKKDFRTKSILKILGETTHPLILVATAWLTNSLLILIGVYLFFNILITGASFVYTVKKYRPDQTPDPQLINFGQHLSLINIFNRLGQHLDKILVFAWLGASELALYSLILIPVKELAKLSHIPGQLVLPTFSSLTLGQLKKHLLIISLSLSVLMGVLAFIYIIIAPQIYHWFFPAYSEAVSYSQFFALSLVLTPALLFQKALIARAQIQSLYFLELVATGLQVLFLILLLPSWGLLGAIYALLSGELVKFSLGAILCYILPANEQESYTNAHPPQSLTKL